MSVRVVIAFAVAFTLSATPAAAAEAVTPAELLAGRYAGEEITITGELVGDYGERRDGWTWAQLNDDGYARNPLLEEGPLVGANIGIGVRMPRDLARGLDPAGGYRTRGPIVTVTGVWKYHDPDRGGESYLEATALVVAESGRPLSEPAEPVPYLVGLGLIAIAVLAYPRRGRPD